MSIAIPTAGIGNSPGTQIGQGPNAEVVFQDSPCGVHAAHAMNARAGSVDAEHRYTLSIGVR
jgi:beta-phosphoglucomutase-like phosphatase (HAD superfamily)